MFYAGISLNCRGRAVNLLVERRGVPPAIQLSTANAHDSVYLERCVDAIPSIFGPPGKPRRPRFRPDKLHGDKGYDYPEKRRARRRRGIAPRFARKGIESSERQGRYRWVVERSLAWLLGFRRLGVRYERRAGMLQGLLHLACALICLRFLSPSERSSPRRARAAQLVADGLGVPPADVIVAGGNPRPLPMAWASRKYGPRDSKMSKAMSATPPRSTLRPPGRQRTPACATNGPGPNGAPQCL
jgi:hypothetical protein